MNLLLRWPQMCLSYSTFLAPLRAPLHPPRSAAASFRPEMSRTVRPVHHRRGSTQLHGPNDARFPLNQAEASALDRR